MPILIKKVATAKKSRRNQTFDMKKGQAIRYGLCSYSGSTELVFIPTFIGKNK